MSMSVEEIVKQYNELSEPDQLQVQKFVDNLLANRKLPPSELGVLTRMLVECEDEEEKELLSEKITRAFYGSEETDPLPPAA